ncbi:MAG: hypothetical protein HON53_25430 [Planctomycetaceae bacterium]|jgi:hypothetical protein|nr:hypothetical protein [Planctomycetaceae bacterium]MBT6157318.1 hypothetical protein [Planctomycetaceae bacterium]MBT6487676.1 hypothetical protein [Planctomycetaceae bacterium]MBT6495712.1 hypothetical protein [Planctomycetaceae bacterium]
MRRNLISLFMLLAVSTQMLVFGRCDERTGDSPSSETIRQWTVDLDSNSFRIRTLATRRLIGAGRLAADPVGRAIQHGGTEVRERGFLILRRLIKSDNLDASTEAERVLDTLSKADSAPVAVRSAKIVADFHRDQLRLTILEIQKLGGQVSVRSGKADRVHIRKNWKGGDDGLKLLRRLPDVTWLSLEDSQVTDAGLIHIAELKNLKYIYFGHSRVKGPGLVHLKQLKNLYHLSLRYMPVEDQWLRHVGEMSQIQSLGLDDTPVTDDSLLLLEKMTNLKALWLDRSKVSSEGLARLKPFVKIEKLDLDGLTFDASDLKHLESLPKLATLYLNDMPLTDADLVHLEPIETLQRLYLSGTKVTAAGVARFKQAMPKVKVSR